MGIGNELQRTNSSRPGILPTTQHSSQDAADSNISLNLLTRVLDETTDTSYSRIIVVDCGVRSRIRKATEKPDLRLNPSVRAGLVFADFLELLLFLDCLEWGSSAHMAWCEVSPFEVYINSAETRASVPEPCNNCDAGSSLPCGTGLGPGKYL